MLKIAVFVEGQTEAIFIRTLLQLSLKAQFLQIIFIKLNDSSGIKSSHSILNPYAGISFTIYDVEGDGNLVSSIREREKNMFVAGFDEIIGLTDLYSHNYDSLSKGKIDVKLNKKMLNIREQQVKKMSRPSKISLFFAIMEIEAWILAIPKIFMRISPQLTNSEINKICGYDLTVVNPQTQFYRPSSELSKILSIAKKKYDKSRSCIESIVSKIDKSDLEYITGGGKVESFQLFYGKILSVAQNYKI